MRYSLRTLMIVAIFAIAAPLTLLAAYCVIWAVLVTKISLP